MKHHSAQREYWRSLEHLANTPEIQRFASNEFASYDPDGMLSMPSLTRRRFMKLMGASMALAGLTLSGCRRWPEENLAPTPAVRRIARRAFPSNTRRSWKWTAWAARCW